MLKKISIILTCLLLLSLLVFAPSEVAMGEIIEIPIDQDKMNPIDPSFYISDTEYKDPSIHVVVEYSEYEGTKYLTARVTIANATQIRAGVTGDLWKQPKRSGKAEQNDKWWLEHLNAILAMNSDSYNVNFSGFGRHAVRQGVVVKNDARERVNDGFYGFDALIIDDKGDFHIIQQATEDDFEVYDGTIVNCFSFGPALVIDGEPVLDLTQGAKVDKYGLSFYMRLYGAAIKARRICIAQTGPLSYMIIASEGPDDKKNGGLTMFQFASLVQSFDDIQVAYCMDGGSSCRVLFNNRSIESVSPTKRRLTDMIYFASAYRE